MTERNLPAPCSKRAPRALSSAPDEFFLLGQRGYSPRSNRRTCLHGGGAPGFTNTSQQFEFKPGSRWVFAMHGPNRANYPNEGVFREI
jgi:hypothetical protein